MLIVVPHEEADGPGILRNPQRRSNTIDERFTRLLIEGPMNDDTCLVQQGEVIDK